MKVYKKNKLDKFWIPLYRRLSTWIVLTTISALIIYLIIFLLNKFNEVNKFFFVPTEKIFILLNINIFLILLLSVIKIYRFVVDIRKVGNIKYYLQSKRLARNIKRNFIDTMLVNKAMQTVRIKVPDVYVNFAEYEQNKVISITIERLAGMDDMEKISTSVSNALNGKFKDYATTIAKDNANKQDFTFLLEDVNRNLRLVPCVPAELAGTDNDAYEYNLQQGVVWTLSHSLISGRSGSGKSTVLYSLLIQMLEKELHDNIYIVDPKNEFSALDDLIKNIAVTPEDALSMLEKVVSIMESREEIVKTKNKESNSLGATARDFGLKPIILIVDEASSMVASFINKKDKDKYQDYLMKIVQRGRSASVFQIQSLQVASTDFLPSAIRNNLGTRILVGTPTTVDLQFMFGTDYHELSRSVDKFTGYYFFDGMSQPQKYFITDIVTHKLNDTSKLKRLDSNNK